MLIAVGWAIMGNLFTRAGLTDMTTSIVISAYGYIEKIDRTTLTAIFVNLLPYMVFSIIYGLYIYKEYCNVGVYVFSRMTNRKSWCMRKIGELYLFSFVYTIIIIVVSLVTLVFTNKIQYSDGTIRLAFFYIMNTSLFICASALLVNALAIMFGSQTAVIISMAIQIICTGLLIFSAPEWDEVLMTYVMSRRAEVLLKINPIGHLVLNWHSDCSEPVNQVINCFGINYPLWSSTVYMLALLIIMTAVINTAVKHRDIIISNPEEG